MTFFKAHREFWRNPLLGSLCGIFAACAAVQLMDLPVLVLIPPLLMASIHSHRLFRERLSERTRRVDEISRMHLATIDCLAKAIDAKDRTTHGHIRRVQVYATELGRKAGLPEEELRGLQTAALLHDIGKLAVPESILNKPGKLTRREFSRMKLHTVIGAEILSQVEFPYPVIPAVRHHHERYDGKGYPDGLRGEQIPMAARVLALADFYDALCSDRPYRRAMPRQKVLEIIHNERGRMFDPRLADLFGKHAARFEKLVEEMPEAPATDMRQFYEWLEDEGRDEQDVAVAKVGPGRPELAHRDVYTLYQLAQSQGNELDLEDTLAIVGNKLARLVPASTCVIYLSSPDSDHMEAMHAHGRHAERFRALRLPRDRGLTGWAITSRRLIGNSDPAHDLQGELADLKPFYHSATSMPLLESEQVFGAVTFYCSEPPALGEDHQRILEIVMAPVARAVRCALSRDRARNAALLDPITGVFNAQALRLQGEELLNRARLHGLPTSVLAMRLIGFDRVNEEYGGHIGDQLLQEVGQRIADELLPGDILARTGNDSFVAVLPDIPRESANTRVAAIQARVLAHAIAVHGRPEIRTGLLVGAAHFPTDGHTLDEVLRVADRGLENDADRAANRTWHGAGRRGEVSLAPT